MNEDCDKSMSVQDCLNILVRNQILYGYLGANLGIKDDESKTALQLAQDEGHTKICEILRRAKC